MATITGLTAERMIEMENATIIDAEIVGTDLILTTRGGDDINAGMVKGSTGATGPTGPTGPAGAASYIPVYTDEAARASAMPSPVIGALSYLSNAPGMLWVYSNGAWGTVGSPPGSIEMTMNANPPPNWVFMFGQTISGAQTLYPVFWANIDPAWKSGSNALIPDMRGRAGVGKDNMGGSPANRITTAIAGFNGANMGAAGGDQRSQAHGHDINDPGHFHGTGETVFDAGFIGFAGGGSGVLAITNTKQTGITIIGAHAGNSQNMPPSLTLNFMVKIL